MSIKKIKLLIELLEYLHLKADLRSREIIDDGVEVSEADRAKASGYANAYSFCINMLKDIVNDQ